MVLPTDTAGTIGAVLDCLRAQPLAHQIEVVLVTPEGSRIQRVLEAPDEFAGIRVVEVPSLSPLGPARAAGIRAASAPLVFLGETHSYPQPGWLDSLLMAFLTGPWDVVACGMINANPGSLTSWAGFIADYGRWISSLPAGEISEAPLYNAVYRREALASLGDGLDGLLSHGDNLRIALQSRGRRAYLSPGTRLAHLNINRLPTAIWERVLAGILIGVQRSGRWPLWKRLAYATAWPLIALVLFRRILPGYGSACQGGGIPWGTLPLILGLQSARAFGEFLGYLGFGGTNHQAQMDELEIHKVAHCAGTAT
ncbi:MAG: glycosyltransferase [Limisphaerales bacterium]